MVRSDAQMTPEVRVERLRRAVDDGSYDVDARAVARSVMRAVGRLGLPEVGLSCDIDGLAVSLARTRPDDRSPAAAGPRHSQRRI
jgi:hypothetical protein